MGIILGWDANGGAHPANQQYAVIARSANAGFQGVDPHTFNGASRDPTKTQLWQSSIKTIFLLMNGLDDQKVTCASFMLKTDAELWLGYNREILSQEWKCDTINIFFAFMFNIVNTLNINVNTEDYYYYYYFVYLYLVYLIYSINTLN